MANCKHCGERLEGDGYKVAYHCPNAEVWDNDAPEPDADPIYCCHEEESE